MDKYKAIAEKITYSLDGYIADHNNRNFGDADGWLRHVRNGWEEFIEAHPDSLNLHEYLQHQQAKVEELQEEFAEDERFLKEQIKDKDLKISNLEYQQGMDKELIQSLQSKSDRLQKQIDALEKSYFVLARIKSIASKNLLESILLKEVRQALKGDQYDEHRKKAEEAISKGASLTNHRIEL